MKKTVWMNCYDKIVCLYNKKVGYENGELCTFIRELVNTETDGEKLPEIINAKNDLNSRLFILNVNNNNSVKQSSFCR